MSVYDIFYSFPLSLTSAFFSFRLVSHFFFYCEFIFFFLIFKTYCFSLSFFFWLRFSLLFGVCSTFFYISLVLLFHVEVVISLHLYFSCLDSGFKDTFPFFCSFFLKPVCTILIRVGLLRKNRKNVFFFLSCELFYMNCFQVFW